MEVARNDSIGAAEALASGADGFLISPGPGRPEAAGVSLGLVEACAEARRPLLGICLGHQAIAVHFGARIERSETPVHGKTSDIAHDRTGLFERLPSPFTAARYHSLEVAPASLPRCLAANASTGRSIQGLRHRRLPIHGVQFHPESVASEHGHALLAAFLELVQASGPADLGGRSKAT